MVKKPIPVRSALSKEEFHREYFNRPGCPVVLTDAMNAWPALSEWTWEAFQDNFSDTKIIAVAPQARTKCSILMYLHDYIEYLKNPTQEPRGVWRKGNWSILQKLNMPLYATNFNPVGDTEDNELLKDVGLSPYCAEDWSLYLPKFVKRKVWQLHHHCYVYLSTKGAVTELHNDFWNSHAYLAQIKGKKYCILISPDYDKEVQESIKAGNHRNGSAPDIENIVAYEGILEPGQMLCFPGGWWHYVVTLENSITFSYDWFDRSNARIYLKSALQEYLKANFNPYPPIAIF